MFAIGTTELRDYGKPYWSPLCGAMSLQDERRAHFRAWMEASGLNMSRVAIASGVQYNTLRSYVGDGTGKQTASLTGVNEAKIARAYNLAVEDIFGEMPGEGDRQNHIRAWREFRNMTIDVLAEAVGVPPSNIEYLEGQAWAPSDKWLRRLAPALNTMPGFLAEFDPNDVPTSALDAALEALNPTAAKPAAAPKSKKARAA